MHELNPQRVVAFKVTVKGSGKMGVFIGRGKCAKLRQTFTIFIIIGGDKWNYWQTIPPHADCSLENRIMCSLVAVVTHLENQLHIGELLYPHA